MASEEKKIRITNMVNQWNQIRWNNKKALRLLSSGSYFPISSSEVKMWANAPIKPKNIHSYIGVENQKLYFILIDSETDRKPLSELESFELDKIIIREFDNNLDIFTPNFIDKTIDGNITVKEALSRNLFWQLMKGSWVNDQIESVRDMQVGIARVFSTPFSDLENILHHDENADILAVMGLKHQDESETKNEDDIVYKKSPYQLDLCFWGLNTQTSDLRLALAQNESPVEDLTQICPPYLGNSDSFSIIFPEKSLETSNIQ